MPHLPLQNWNVGGSIYVNKQVQGWDCLPKDVGYISTIELKNPAKDAGLYRIGNQSKSFPTSSEAPAALPYGQ